MAFLVKFENGNESGLKVSLKLFQLTDRKDCEWLYGKVVDKVYEFKIQVIDGDFGLIYGKGWTESVKSCRVKQGCVVLFYVRNAQYVLVSHFDEHGNCVDGFKMIEDGIKMTTCLAQTSKMSSLKQPPPESIFEGYDFKKQTLYCVRTCNGWMRAHIDFDMNKPSGLCGYEWEKFFDKHMIDGSQAFVIYFIVGHHFILTIHDADGFCEDPEFRHSAFWRNARPFSLISSDFCLKCPPFALGPVLEKVIKDEEDDLFATDKIVEPDNHALSAKRRKVPYVVKKSTEKCAESSNKKISASSNMIGDGYSFLKKLGNTTKNGYLTIPAEFVRTHKLYNYIASDDQTKGRVCYLHSSFDKEIVLRKYTNKSRAKEFDDHVVMLGKWKQIMNEAGFAENQTVKFTVDDGVLSNNRYVRLTME